MLQKDDAEKRKKKLLVQKLNVLLGRRKRLPPQPAKSARMSVQKPLVSLNYNGGARKKPKLADKAPDGQNLLLLGHRLWLAAQQSVANPQLGGGPELHQE